MLKLNTEDDEGRIQTNIRDIPFLECVSAYLYTLALKVIFGFWAFNGLLDITQQ